MSSLYAGQTGDEVDEVPLAKLRRDLRRAWLDRDLAALAKVLQELAPRHEYRTDELARGLQMTSRHLRRIFATALARAPREWLNQRRLLAASQLLVTGRSVKDTAYSLGFCSPSQFSRDFRGHFGMTPSTFVRRQSPIHDCVPAQ